MRGIHWHRLAELIVRVTKEAAPRAQTATGRLGRRRTEPLAYWSPIMNSGERRYVRASDRRLAEVATQAAARIDLETLRHRRSEASGVTTERSLDGTVVTATCVIECSAKEMHAMLAPPTSERYACIMRELVGPDFIYGAIVHHAEEISDQNVTVKTATFVKRHMLARNEQWCFVTAVKALEPSEGSHGVGFTVALASLHPDDVFIGKAQAASVIHLQGLSAIYLVTPRSPGNYKTDGRSALSASPSARTWRQAPAQAGRLLFRSDGSFQR